MIDPDKEYKSLHTICIRETASYQLNGTCHKISVESFVVVDHWGNVTNLLRDVLGDKNCDTPNSDFIVTDKLEKLFVALHKYRQEMGICLEYFRTNNNSSEALNYLESTYRQLLGTILGEDIDVTIALSKECMQSAVNIFCRLHDYLEKVAIICSENSFRMITTSFHSVPYEEQQ